MSIEFNFTCESAFSEVQAENLISQLEAKSEWAIVSQEGLELRLKFPPFESLASTWPEDFALSFEGKRIYIAFHAATGAQREHFLECLSHLLISEKVRFLLEEI